MFAAPFEVLVEHHPDGGDAGREGHLLLGDDPAQDGHVQDFPARQDLLASCADGPEGRAPGIGVKHGDDVQHTVPLAHAEGGSHGVAVQYKPAVGIGNALGIPRRGRSVAEQRLVPFAEAFRKVVAFRERGDPLVVQVHRRQAGLRHLSGLRHDHEVPDGLQLVLYQLHEEEQVLVHENDLVLGVVQDVDEMVRGQPEIHRVKRGPHAGDTEVKLQMAVAVQGDAGHAVALADAQRGQGVGELAGSLEVIGVGVAEGLTGVYGDQLFSGEVFRCPKQEGSQQQGIVHHGFVSPFSVHGSRGAPHL